MHSIRLKTTAITISAVITAIVCIFLASFSIIQAENDVRSVETMNLVAADTCKSLEKYTENIEQSVEVISHLASDTMDSVTLIQNGLMKPEGLDERTPKQVAEFDSYLSSYCSRLQTDFATVAGHTRGVITYYYCISPDISTSEHGFFYSRVGKTGFGEREPIDARELDPNDTEHTVWYYTPIERGRPSWVGPYAAHYLGEMVICSYLVPVYKAGIFIGVLGMDIPLATLVEQVSSIHVYETGFACLLDAEGHVLYHPDLAYGSTLDLTVGEEVLRQESNGNTLMRYTAANGEERQLSFATLSNGMKLAIVAPVGEVYATAAQLVRIVLPGAIVIIVIVASLTFLAMRYLTRPLLRLTAASQRLASADYDVELDYAGNDEIGALTNSFKRMRDQLEEYIDDLNRKAHTDDLTGLPNQRYFFELATAEKERLLAEGASPVILYFNLGGMKHFNLQYGFEEGDRLICEVADILARHYGKQCTGHFGQDHFAAISAEEGLEPKLLEVLRDCQHTNSGMSLPVSVGIYQHSTGEVNVSVACDRAKFACDRRRGSYISGYSYFDSEMQKQVELIRHVINHLDEALEERWVQVYYQPIVRSSSGKVCDEEALARWIDPEMGFLSPAQFIPALEKAGLIYKLDLYVLDQVLEKMRFQEESGFTVVPHSINLSRSDFDSCDIVEEICKRVDASGYSRDRITIEITESIIGRDFDFMKEQVERFQRLGFPVWMDDFGSGYSTLDFLQSIQFDLLKFDMSFLRKLDEGPNGKIILTDMMQMAHELGVDTICEGVETDSHVQFLQKVGCSKLQGYYFGKPLPLSTLVQQEQNDQVLMTGYESPEESDQFDEAVTRNRLFVD